MNEKFRVTWGVEDGYAGGARPHYFSIRVDALNGDEDDAALNVLFYAELEQEFQDKITPYSADRDAFVAWAKERIAEMNKEDS